MRHTSAFVLAVAIGAATVPSVAHAQDDDAFERQREQMLDRQRRVILNNDGGDAVVAAKQPTRQGMLAARTIGLEDTHVDTIFYCTNRGTFSRHSHRTEVGETFTRTDGRYESNVVPALIQQGTDPLQVMIEWCRDNDVEIFWSERMNDRHDAGRPELVSEWKRQHPECLMSTKDDPPPHGAWSQVDYSHEPVRRQMLAVIEEVCRNYDVDGIEMDFFRHPCYFRTVAWGQHATDEQIAIMTGFVRGVREMTERVGRERGRPILVAIRVPDSVPLARAMGLDLEAWLSEGLVDLMTGSGYFRMNPWSYLVELGHRHGIRVYAGLSDSRVQADTTSFNRRSQDSYRARAARAWQAGVNGIYLFNMFNPRMQFLHEIGEPEVLAGLDKTYFATVRGGEGPSYGNPDYWVANGSQWRNLPILTPEHPISLSAGASRMIPLYIGDDLSAARDRGLRPEAVCHVAAIGAADVRVRLNGRQLRQRSVEEQWLHFPLPEGLLRPGENRFELSSVPIEDEAQQSRWDVEWTAEALPGMPWGHGRFRGERVFAEMQDDALLVADRGTEPGDYLYFSYPWGALPERPAEAEAEVRVISGWNNLTVRNGVATERVTLYPDHIGTYHTGLRYDMDTTDAYHTYRVVVQGEDIRIYVDGELRIDGEGMFTQPAGGRNTVSFGAANSPSKGEALWRAVRLRSPGTSGAQVHDLVVTVRFPEDE
ncbi:MAG: hypothetical protein ACP5KN_13730 [Armatimonadota bacterium]